MPATPQPASAASSPFPTPVRLPGNIPAARASMLQSRSCPSCRNVMTHVHCAGSDCRYVMCLRCEVVMRPDIGSWYSRKDERARRDAAAQEGEGEVTA